MGTLWFCLIALMIAAYVVLDGFDLGAGIIHLLVAKTPAERLLVLRSIGPVWNGNEVWLLVAGGTLHFTFPALYASGFSGFYLLLMIVLWLLILRGVSIEFRSALENALWASFWDTVFCLASLLLVVLYGAALGNVVRGVPLDAQHRFFEPLWTNFQLGSKLGVLDWYTILSGLMALTALTLHGALWVTIKTEDPIRKRSQRLGQLAWWGVVVITVFLTIATFKVQAQELRNLRTYPLGYVFPGLAMTGLILTYWDLFRQNYGRAFLASCAYLVGMLTSVVFGIYPYVLPASTDSVNALTIQNAKAPDYGLRIGLIWWGIGMALVIGYFFFAYRHFAGKAQPGTTEEHY